MSYEIRSCDKLLLTYTSQTIAHISRVADTHEGTDRVHTGGIAIAAGVKPWLLALIHI